jgi:hypothetical protein
MWYTGSSETLIKEDGGTPEPAHTLSGNHSEEAALIREQWEQLGNNDRKN